MDIKKLTKEARFTHSLNSGAGGQHVNRVHTKVELHLHIDSSKVLSDEEKAMIKKELKNRINKDGELYMMERAARDQSENKEKLILKLEKLITKAITPKKPRKATRPTKAAIEKKKSDKIKQSEKKSTRKKL